MKIHVCLVSDQVLANLIPALMERPDKILLVTTAEMKRRKQDFKQWEILTSHGLLAEITKGEVPDVRLASIRRYANEMLESVELKNAEEVTLNATGGTKLMTLGFTEAFRQRKMRVIYTDTAHQCIEELGSDALVPMGNRLDVPGYLGAQGVRYQSASSDDVARLSHIEQRKAVATYLAKNAEALNDFFGVINILVDKAFDGTQDTLGEPLQNLRYAPHPKSPWNKALKKLATANLIAWNEGSTEITFVDVDRSKFLRGGWLEEYAFHALHDEKVFDVRLDIEVSGDASGVTKNQFDVLAVHGNRLLFIECKTVRFDKHDNDNDITYKLDSLGKAARGLFGETWLLSGRPPTPILLERLRGARIRLIGPDELPRLCQLVQAWMRSGA